MSGKSEFSLISNRYLFHGESLACVVTNDKFARPLLNKLTDLESTDGTEIALRVLCSIVMGRLSEVARLPTSSDHAAARSNVVGPEGKYGKRHTCLKCSQKFFDLHGKVKGCPQCHTPINIEL